MITPIIPGLHRFKNDYTDLEKRFLEVIDLLFLPKSIHQNNPTIPSSVKSSQKKNHPPKGRWLEISYLIPLLK